MLYSHDVVLERTEIGLTNQWLKYLGYQLIKASFLMLLMPSTTTDYFLNMIFNNINNHNKSKNKLKSSISSRQGWSLGHELEHVAHACCREGKFPTYHKLKHNTTKSTKYGQLQNSTYYYWVLLLLFRNQQKLAKCHWNRGIKCMQKPITYQRV